MRRLFLIPILVVIAATSATAQSTCSSNTNKLYCVPILAVNNAQDFPFTVVPIAPAPFSSLNAALGIQLSQVPTPSPASGIVFALGPTGLLSRQRELGPIFSEAPPTVGRHKLYAAFTYQYLIFDQIDDVSLKQIPLQIRGCDETTTPGCNGFIQTNNRLDLKVNQFTTYFTFGLFNRVDVSVAIPILDVRMGMQTTCSACSQQEPPSKQQPSGSVLIFAPGFTTASATGIGDVTFRLKGAVLNGEHVGLAVGVDFRTPTGDALNFLGAGTIGVRPFAAVGYRGRISPHADIAFRANGKSILESAAQSGSAQLPDSLDYSAGVDVGVFRSLSVTGDFLGQTFFNASRVFLVSRAGSPDIACGPSSVTCQEQNFSTKNFALGGKINPVGNFLISANVLFKLDHNGLHYKPAPMLGISYTF